jgi:hypothetical protein
MSDLFLPKPTCGLGLILGVLFTALFFVWENHSRMDLLWKCFKDSLKITFIFMAVLSFLFRPFFAGGRYAGIFTNPNTFGLYMFVIFTVFMSDVDWMVETNRPVKKQVLTMIQMALVLFYISVSQARTAMIAVAFVLLVWLICRIRIDFKRHMHKPFFKTMVLLIVFTAALYPIYFEGLNHIPDLVGHPVIYHDDTLYMQSGEKIEDIGEKLMKEEEAGEKAAEKAAEQKAKKDGKKVPSTGGNKLSENNVVIRTIDTLINSFTGGSEGSGIDNLNRLSSGRITIYKAYSADLNLWGHHDVSKKINNHTVAHAHNNYLQYGYTYGVLAMILYGILTVLLFIRSIGFYLRGHRKYAAYSFLPCAIIVGFLAATMTECMFQPFEIYPAFAFWLACGVCFQAPRKVKIK